MIRNNVVGKCVAAVKGSVTVAIGPPCGHATHFTTVVFCKSFRGSVKTILLVLAPVVVVVVFAAAADKDADDAVG